MDLMDDAMEELPIENTGGNIFKNMNVHKTADNIEYRV